MLTIRTMQIPNPKEQYLPKKTLPFRCQTNSTAATIARFALYLMWASPLSSAIVFGQAPILAQLRFRIVDSTGRALPETTIHVEDVASHRSQDGKSAADGTSSFTLQPGEYSISISHQGFSTYSEKVHVNLGMATTHQILLRLQTIESVQVSEQPDGINSLPLSHANAGLLGDQDRLDQPFLVTAYSYQNAEQRGSETIGDSLEGDASIVLATGSQKNSPFFEMIYSRGLAINNYTGVAVDGLYGLGGTLPITDPVAVTEHLSGPAAFLAGVPGNVGGTLNLIPKRANARQLIITPEYTSNGIGGIHGDVSSRFGSHDELGLRATSMYRAGDTSIVANHIWQTASALDVDYRRSGLTATLDVQHDRTLNRGYSLYDGFAAGVAIPQAPSGNLSTQLAWMEAWDRDIRILGRARYVLRSNWEIFAGAGHTDSRFEYGGFCQATVTSATGTASCLPIQSANLASISSVEAGTKLQVRTGFVTHRLYAAFNRISYPTNTYGTLILSSSPLFFNIYSAVRPNQSLLRAPRPATYLTAYQKTPSFAVADTLALLHERLAITVGGRWTAPSAVSYLSTGIISASTSASQWSPAIAAVYRFHPSLSVYGNVVQALEPAGKAPGTAANANAIFPALESQQQEVGTKFRHHSLNAEIGLFRIQRANQYLELTNNTYTQNGLQSNRGVDGRIWLQAPSGTSLQVTASYVDAILKRTSGGTFDGKRAPGVPKLSARFSGLTGVPFSRHALQVGAFVDVNSSTFYENSNTRSLPGWWKLTPTIRYSAGKEHSFSGEFLIENITGESYWIGGGNGLVSVGDARSYQVRLAKRFR